MNLALRCSWWCQFPEAICSAPDERRLNRRDQARTVALATLSRSSPPREDDHSSSHAWNMRMFQASPPLPRAPRTTIFYAPRREIHAQKMTRAELAHFTKDRQRRRHIVVTHVERVRAAVNGELHRSKRAQRFEFAAPRQERGGRKREVTVANRYAITHAVIERFHAEAIAHEPQHPLSSIKQRDGKHAREVRDRALNAP